jgi:hypothetical protein
MKLTTHLHPVPRSRICLAIPPLPQYAFMSCCSVTAQGQLYLCFGTDLVVPRNVTVNSGINVNRVFLCEV